MTLRLHNTLTGELDDFVSIKTKEVGMYSCGPTVYNYAHIGNLRSYVFADTVRRSLEYFGYKIKHVINITDIGHLSSDADAGDDKMVKGLKREGLPLTLDGLKALADNYEQAFKQDLEDLNIESPDAFPRATAYLSEDISLIQTLEEKGFTYMLPDGVYFNTEKLPDYGKLGGLTPLDESKARIESEGKKNPRDFVLWKLSGEDRLGFESPWGIGFPGWHIECSAMSRALLGQPFDIHTGGIDHIPVHHNNEIAQSEAAYGEPLAHYWLHNEFITVSGGKMAKSEDNFITLRTLIEKGFSPLAYRYFLLQSHYRTPTNFSWEAIQAAQNAYRKLKDTLSNLPLDGTADKKYMNEFAVAIENDLNTSEALAVVWKLLKDETIVDADKRATLLNFDRVLGLKLDDNEFAITNIPEEIQKLLNKRAEARLNKDFQKSDELREKIRTLGYEVEDKESGQTLKKI